MADPTPVQRVLTSWTDKRKDLPNTGAPNFDQRMLQTVRTLVAKEGDPLDSAVTLGQLVRSGIVAIDVGALPVGGGGRGVPPVRPGPGVKPDDDTPDLTPPPTPTGFIATAGVTRIVVEHDPPTYTQGHGHGKAILYGAIYAGGALPTFANAVKLLEFPGSPTDYATNPATTYRLWITWVSKDGVESPPAGGTNGLGVTTAQDVRTLLDAITNAAQAPSAPFSRFAIRAGLFYVANDVNGTSDPVFSVVTAEFEMNGVRVPAGVYMRDGYIMNGTITNAKIASLAVDDAKIANLSVSKLKAGSIAVGEFIQSTNFVSNQQGWRINGNGTAEFSGVIVRGTIYASSGSIGGNVIDSTGVQSPGYSAANNTGWRIGSDGAAVFNFVTVRGNVVAQTGSIGGNTIDNTGLQSPGYNPNSSGWRISSDGSAIFNFVSLRGNIRGGAFNSYNWPSNGGTGFYLGAEGLLLGNANSAPYRYFQVDANGNIYTRAFRVVDGVMTLLQIDLVDTENLKANTVTIPAGARLTSEYSGTGIALAVSINSNGAPVFVAIDARFYRQTGGDGSGGDGPYNIPYFVNGQQQGVLMGYVNSDGFGSVTGNLFLPSTGSGTISISMNGTTGIILMTGTNMFAILTKR